MLVSELGNFRINFFIVLQWRLYGVFWDEIIIDFDPYLI